MFASIILFLFLTLSFGFVLTSMVRWKESRSIIERIVIRLGIGLGMVVVLGVVFQLLGIVIDWKIFAGVALLLDFGIVIWKRKELLSDFTSMSFKLTKEDIFALGAVALFLISLFMYTSGAFGYPYLENEDPWTHSVGVSFIAHAKTLDDPVNYNVKFLDPYPPGYEMWLGILHQVEPSVSFVLKFYNALFIALGILFFYFMMRSFGVERSGALFSTFVLMAIPSFFTHFIWAHTLSIVLFFVAIYCLEMTAHDRKWVAAAMIVVASIFLTHPDEGLKVAIMIVLYILVKSVYMKKVQFPAVAGLFGGFVVSLLWWATHASAVLSRHTGQILSSGKYSVIQSAQGTILGMIQKYFPPNQGTATRAYAFKDFFFAEPFGMINVQVGWGVVVSILLLCALVFIMWKFRDVCKRENYWVGVGMAWFIFTFLGTNSMTFDLPVGLYAFRFWLLLAIPVAMLSWVGVQFLQSIGSKLKLAHVGIIIMVIVVIGVFFTSFTAKYNQNAKAQWPPGVSWSSAQELQLYVWLKTALPVGTSVFSFGNKAGEIIGMDKYSCEWCLPVTSFRSDIIHTNATALHTFLKTEGYEYLVFEVGALNLWKAQNVSSEAAIGEAEGLLNSMVESGGFSPVQQIQNGGFVFKVN